MVTEGPAGEDTSVYDITLSEIHQNMWAGGDSNQVLIWRADLWANQRPHRDCSIAYCDLIQRCSNTKVPYIKEDETAECKTFLVPYDDYLREFINSKAGKPASPHLESTMHEKI